MEEEWRDIKGYEGLYQVSNLGKVRSLDRYINARNKKKRMINGTLLRLRFNNSNYNIVSLYKDNVQDIRFVHRLVAETFIPNPEDKPQVNHIDGNKTNNCVNNLEWCTRSENNRHAWKTGLNKVSDNQRKAASQSAKERFSKKIVQYDLNGNFIKEWDSMSEAQRQLNIWHESIGKCCKGKIKTSGKYIWRFKEENDEKI